MRQTSSWCEAADRTDGRDRAAIWMINMEVTQYQTEIGEDLYQRKKKAVTNLKRRIWVVNYGQALSWRRKAFAQVSVWDLHFHLHWSSTTGFGKISVSSIFSKEWGSSSILLIWFSRITLDNFGIRYDRRGKGRSSTLPTLVVSGEVGPTTHSLRTAVSKAEPTVWSSYIKGVTKRDLNLFNNLHSKK